jgi:amino-acid N-acetyltransferase
MNRPDAQQQLIWFRNAAPYINAHRGRRFVIHFSGETMQLDSFPGLIHDFALLHSLGIQLVLVHGARPQIEENIQKQAQQSQYHNGLRITDNVALQAVRESVGCLRVEMESRLSLSMPNTPMSGSRIRCISGNFVQARPLGIIDGVDFQHTGKVRRVDHRAISQELELNHVVLLSPMGYSPTGEIFNLSAEDVAREAASSLNADKLIFISDCQELQDTAQQLTPADAQGLINSNDLPGEILRHLSSAIHACEQGVSRVHLVDRSLDGALLQELYTRDGSGILITSEPYERLREAGIEDVGGIIELIEPLEADGTLVRRSREQLELEIDHFRVLERDGLIIGCVALYPFSDDGWGELACLVIHPDYRNQGQASRLLEHIEQHARSMQLRELFVLTTQTAHWFQERGFTPVQVDDLPVQKREMYNLQRQSRAFVKTL